MALLAVLQWEDTLFCCPEKSKDLELQVDQESEDTYVCSSQRSRDMSIPPVVGGGGHLSLQFLEAEGGSIGSSPRRR